jgi:hypothetical protein
MSKSPKRPYQPLLLVVWVCAWFIWMFVVLATAFSWFGLGGHETLIMAVAIPLLGIPVPFAILNLMAFPLPYSVFGRLRRTPRPMSEPVLVIHGSWGTVGGLQSTVPFVSWRVYPMGIGIQVWGIGSAFLPLAAVISIEYDSFGQSVISHSWHELRSPVKGPAIIGQMVQAALGKQNGLPVSRPSRAPNSR